MGNHPLSQNIQHPTNQPNQSGQAIRRGSCPAAVQKLANDFLRESPSAQKILKPNVPSQNISNPVLQEITNKSLNTNDIPLRPKSEIQQNPGTSSYSEKGLASPEPVFTRAEKIQPAHSNSILAQKPESVAAMGVVPMTAFSSVIGFDGTPITSSSASNNHVERTMLLKHVRSGNNVHITESLTQGKSDDSYRAEVIFYKAAGDSSVGFRCKVGQSASDTGYDKAIKMTLGNKEFALTNNKGLESAVNSLAAKIGQRAAKALIDDTEIIMADLAVGALKFSKGNTPDSTAAQSPNTMTVIGAAATPVTVFSDVISDDGTPITNTLVGDGYTERTMLLKHTGSGQHAHITESIDSGKTGDSYRAEVTYDKLAGNRSLSFRCRVGHNDSDTGYDKSIKMTLGRKDYNLTNNEGLQAAMDALKEKIGEATAKTLIADTENILADLAVSALR